MRFPRLPRVRRDLGAAVLLVALAASAIAADGIVTRVIDADTAAIIVFPDDVPGIALVHRGKSKHGVVWDGAHVRIAGIDTPESFRPKCERERKLAMKAKAMMKGYLSPGRWVKVRNIRFGKYAGRLLADVFIERDGKWISVADELISQGLAYPYDGGKKRSWCNGPLPAAGGATREK